MLIETKITRPGLLSDLVRRDSLLQKLDDATGFPLTAVIAPAGYGKTTALCQWLEFKRFPNAWLSIDERDNEPLVFWQGLVQSLSRDISRINQQVLPVFGGLNQVDIETIPELLLKALCEHARSWACPDHYFVVLDDLHLIDNAQLLKQIGRFIDYAPSFLRILITSRTRPALNLPLRQVRRQLLLIEKDDLQFSHKDVGLMLRKRFDLELNETDFDQLYELTKGWAAAVQLVACRISQNKGDFQALIQQGQDDLLADYLLYEIFGFLPPVVTSVLPKLSIFPSFSEDFCRYVLPDVDTALLISEIKNSNLPHTEFKVNGQTIYMLHDILLHWLRSQPMNEETDSAYIIRAVDWYLDNAMLIEALELLKSYTLWERLSQVLAEYHAIMIQQAQFHRGVSVIFSLPEDWVAINPWAMYLIAAVKFAAGDTQACLESVESALELIDTGGSLALSLPSEKDERLALQARCYFLLSHIARLKGDIEESARLAEKIDISLLEKEPQLQAWSLKGQGANQVLQGNLVQAVRLFIRSSQMAIECEDLVCYAASLSWLIPCLIQQGQPSMAEVFIRDASHQMDALWSNHPLAATLPYFKALIARERGQLKEAVELLNNAYEKAGQVLNPYHQVYFRLLEWWLHISQKEMATARRAASQLQRIENEMGISWSFATPEPRVLCALNDAVEGNPVPLWMWANSTRPSTLTGNKARRYTEIPVWLKVQLMAGQIDIEDELNAFISMAENDKQVLRQVQGLLIAAQRFYRLNDHSQALSTLIKCFGLIDPSEMPQLYRDELPDIEPILRLAAKQNELNSLVETILNEPVKNSDMADNSVGDNTREKLNQGLTLESLSERELEILEWLKTGKKNADIAIELNISLATVKTHLRNIYGKLGASNKLEAIKLSSELPG
jgi:LuxR family maltose regulon positive regulatory protein